MSYIRVDKNGFSLVEVLVSIVVLAAGVIGAAGMQLAAARAAQQTAFQNFALRLADDMAEAIRASASLPPNANPLLHVDYRSSDSEQLAPPARFCYMDNCVAEEFAQFELHDWKARVRQGLPGGRLQICRDAVSSNSGNAPSWNCADAQEGNGPVVIRLGWQSKNPDGSLGGHANADAPPIVALAVSLAQQ